MEGISKQVFHQDWSSSSLLVAIKESICLQDLY